MKLMEVFELTGPFTLAGMANMYANMGWDTDSLINELQDALAEGKLKPQSKAGGYITYSEGDDPVKETQSDEYYRLKVHEMFAGEDFSANEMHTEMRRLKEKLGRDGVDHWIERMVAAGKLKPTKKKKHMGHTYQMYKEV